MKPLVFRLFLLLPILASFSKCTSDDSPTPGEQVAPCTDKAYVLVKKYENITGTIVQGEAKDSNGDKLFYIDATSETKTIPLNACNLPAKARVKGVKIKFSGHTLTYPGFDNVNVEALPFQLSKIEYN